MDIPTNSMQLTASAAMLWTWAVDFVPRLGTALLILVLGFLVAKWASRAIAGFAPRGLRVDETVRPVLAAVVRYGILILVLVAALGQLGVQTASLLAILGAAGLAIGLALQGTLSNIAAGLMLLWLRPFRVGEYIETPTVAGVVREVGLFATRLDTFDGLYRFVPNSEIWNKPVINHSRNPARVLNLAIGIPLDADVDAARHCIEAVLDASTEVMAERPREVFVDTMTDNFIFLSVRAWLPASGFWPAHRVIVAAIRRRLADAGIAMQRLLHPSPDIGDAFGHRVTKAAARAVAAAEPEPEAPSRH